MTAVRIEGLRKSYGAVQALDGLDLTVEPGTIFGFLGPNGAGKTTTMRILAGLAHPTSGRVQIAGLEIPSQARQAAARIGYLPEEPAFYPWMTPRETLDHVGRLFGLPAGERANRTTELLDLAGLADVAKRRIGGFSRGMRQRLGLAQALVNRPEILLLDEAVSALDPAGRKEVLDLLERLRGECTVFMSTHILADVERVCDTIGIIARGRLVTQDSRTALLARYAVPAFEIEADPGLDAALASWGETVQRQPWVHSLTLSGLTARILVDDVEAAKRELLHSAVEAGLVLTRYEIVRPSLEDVFLRLVGEGTGA